MVGVLGTLLVVAVVFWSPLNRAIFETTVIDEGQIEIVPELSSLVATVGSEEIKNVAPGNSWPGEIISSSIAQIQPQRD